MNLHRLLTAPQRDGIQAAEAVAQGLWQVSYDLISDQDLLVTRMIEQACSHVDSISVAVRAQLDDFTV